MTHEAECSKTTGTNVKIGIVPSGELVMRGVGNAVNAGRGASSSLGCDKDMLAASCCCRHNC